MKLPNNGGINVSCFWKMAFSLSLIFGVPRSQAASCSVGYINLTLDSEKWAISVAQNPASFEEDLPSKKMIGLLVKLKMPTEAKGAYIMGAKFSTPPDTESWIAFVARGGDASERRRKAPVGEGATGVVIYDHSHPDREILILTCDDACDIATIMISSLKGNPILQLIKDGIQVTAVIEVGAMQCFYKIYLCLFFLLLAFVGCAALCCTPGQTGARQEERSVRAAKAELRKAVDLLELRKLKRNETDLAGETCVVCLETYKPREVVRILTCRHVFHKRCIDRWLLKRGICPICNHAVIQRN
uniref:RING finger protein 148-like n=1 Tax=Podarcis muralis TaxID=64176 RepID=UPI00109FF24A|nr:RING finger protein 148-like [Podarcis muralis]